MGHFVPILFPFCAVLSLNPARYASAALGTARPILGRGRRSDGPSSEMKHKWSVHYSSMTRLRNEFTGKHC